MFIYKSTGRFSLIISTDSWIISLWIIFGWNSLRTLLLKICFNLYVLRRLLIFRWHSLFRWHNYQHKSLMVYCGIWHRSTLKFNFSSTRQTSPAHTNTHTHTFAFMEKKVSTSFPFEIMNKRCISHSLCTELMWIIILLSGWFYHNFFMMLFHFK